MTEKDLNISEIRGAKKNISDLQVYGDGDTFALLCKASSQEQGWMKSTKVCNVDGGCVMQVTTQQKNLNGSYAVAEALTYVPGVHIDKESDPRRMVPIPQISKRVSEGQPLFDELKNLADPLVKLLKNNYHPHCQIVIDGDRVRIVEDLVGVPVSEKGAEKK